MNKEILDEIYVISVIVPVYNTEKYLKRCIDSILNQTYKNLEIIVVDDGSIGNEVSIIEQYEKSDSRVKLLKHVHNKGLFSARLTGVEKATGDYIVFVDSDDYITCDYFHTLLENALKYQSDITIGNTVREDNTGKKFVYNFHNSSFENLVIEGNDVKETFFGQKGYCYSWHTIWNKMYSKELWEKCLPYYKRINEHIVLTEDIAFSSVLFYFSQKVSSVPNDAYIYCINAGASTDSANLKLDKFQKNIHDITVVFNFVEDFLNEMNSGTDIKNNFRQFRYRYALLWKNHIVYHYIGIEKEKAFKALDNFYRLSKDDFYSKDNDFFESQSTEWIGGLESIKDKIKNNDCHYISFDIFDTLICRPFYKPTDLFELLNKDLEELLPTTSLDFTNIRESAEQFARAKYGKLHPEWDDVTLTEIYNVLEEVYGLPHDIAKKLQTREEELEIKFSQTRNSGKELYELSLLNGKEIILISDMYLEKHIIQKILEKNGYTEYKYLFLSSEKRATKNSGKLYDNVLHELSLKKEHNTIHIGDNYVNDYIKAQTYGFNTIFLPKSKEIFENIIKGNPTNNCSVIDKQVAGNLINGNDANTSLGVKILKAMVCNKYFDNPYRNFNFESDFNIDPYLIGYYAVGMHMIGLCCWIIEQTKDNEKIFFLSRDGYLPKKSYDIYTNALNGCAKSQYLYTSRKALIPGMIKSKFDLYDLPIEYNCHTPQSLFIMLDSMYPKNTDMNQELIKYTQCCGHDINCTFKGKNDYIDFIHWFLNNVFNEKELKQNQAILQQYFYQIQENDICFDMGYSGRIQKAISSATGKGVDVLFVHRDSQKSQKMSRMGGFKIKSFYNFIPSVSGLLREHLLSDCFPACIGYTLENNTVIPQFDTEEKIYPDIFVVQTIQRAALDMVKEYVTTFADYLDIIQIQPLEASLPFEGYLACSKEIDKSIFSSSYFEDQIYAAKDNINIEHFCKEFYKPTWKTDSFQQSSIEDKLSEKSTIIKAIVYFLTDKSIFIHKFSMKLMKYPRLYVVCKKIYLKTGKRGK